MEEKALKCLQQTPVVENEEIQSEIYFLFGEVYDAMELYDVAKDAYEQVTAIDEDFYIAAQVKIGEYAFLSEDYDKALAIFSAIPEDIPGCYANALFYLSLLAHEDENTKEEKELLLRITEEMDSVIYNEAQFALALLEIQNMNFYRAKKYMENVDLSDDDEWTQYARYIAAIVEMQNKEFEAALKLLEKVKRIGETKTFAQAKSLQARIYLQTGDDEKAYVTFQEIKETDDPEIFALAAVDIGVYHIRQERYEQAIEMWESVREADSPEAYAEAQEKLKNIDIEQRLNAGDTKAFLEFSQDVQEGIIVDNLEIAIKEAKAGKPEALQQIVANLEKDNEKFGAGDELIKHLKAYLPIENLN